MLGGAKYYYVKNLQGDIISIIDSAGATVCTYAYDAWGNILSIKDASGNNITDENHIANQNPFRYRGYFYDTETGLYYLNSRYYDPETGRFINADGQINTSQGVLGCNMYAYCLNNPVNTVDYDGHKPGDLFDTMDEAARDFAMCYNGASISDNLEYATSIYQVKTTVKTYKTVTTTHRFLWWTWTSTSTKTIKTTKIQYTYKTIKKGNNDGVVPPSAPLFKKAVGYAHTHAAYDPAYDNDNFSDHYDIKGKRQGDVAYAINKGVPLYMATHLGTLRRYDPSDGSDIELYNDIPWDNHPNR